MRGTVLLVVLLLVGVQATTKIGSDWRATNTDAYPQSVQETDDIFTLLRENTDVMLTLLRELVATQHRIVALLAQKEGQNV